MFLVINGLLKLYRLKQEFLHNYLLIQIHANALQF